MAHKVENMASVGQVPWHGLGFNTKAGMSATAMRKAAQQEYTVNKLQAGVQLPDGTWLPDPAGFYLVRDTDNKILSHVGKLYQPVQTDTIFQFFHDFVEAGSMTMETAGSLDGGKIVWALARVKQADFAIKGDEMRNYLLLCSPFERGMALTMQWTNVRVVCWNTLCMALGSNLKGKGHAFRMAHTRDFKVEKEEAKLAMGLIVDQSKVFADAAALLAKKKAKADEVELFFQQVLGKTPDDIKSRIPAALPKYRAALENAPGAQMITTKGTWWGAVNAVTWVVDHEQGKSRDSALKNAWLGNQAILKRKALDLALEAAK
jgi:phage/plasmid-like protein (TIGR03299 family)